MTESGAPVDWIGAAAADVAAADAALVAAAARGATTAVSRLAAALRRRGWLMACAESCTGGLIAGTCTALAGSSDWFERGVVTYSNRAKRELLDVDAALIERHGAVSEPVAMAMVAGLLVHAPVDWAVAVTGIAGPGGGTLDKPVGTVWLAWGRAGVPATLQAQRLQLPGGRAAVRWQTVAEAFARLEQAVAAAP